MRKVIVALVLAIFIATSIAVVGVEFFGVGNETPAEPLPVDIWSLNQYKANTHTHTTRSDGDFTPQQQVYHYQELGYDILAISDHYLGFNTFEEIGITDYNLTPIASNEAEAMFAAHINLFYCYLQYAFDFPENILQEVERQGGIAVVNHPGRYDNIATIKDFRVSWYEQFPCLVALEIVNRNDRYDTDRKHWDDLLTHFMPERIIYGMAADDAHDDNDMGWSYTMFLAPDCSPESIEYAFRNGHYYPVTKALVENPQGEAPRITRITENDDGTISIEGTNYHTVTWISCGEIVGYGETFDASQCEKYVRFELEGEGGTAFSQPIAITPKV